VISENAMLYALYSMGYHNRATIHGLRGTASPILYEAGTSSNESQRLFHEDGIEVQLAHEDEVRASYNSAEYLPQLRRLLQWWGDYLDKPEKSVDLIG
jgi:hypothetical protein